MGEKNDEGESKGRPSITGNLHPLRNQVTATYVGRDGEGHSRAHGCRSTKTLGDAGWEAISNPSKPILIYFKNGTVVRQLSTVIDPTTGPIPPNASSRGEG